MSECVDTEARDRCAKLFTRLGEVAAVLWGDDVTRSNGLRSVVQAQGEKIGELEVAQRTIVETWHHYQDAERGDTCLGLKALAQYEQEGQEAAREETPVQVAKFNMKAAIIVALVAAVPSTLVAVANMISIMKMLEKAVK